MADAVSVRMTPEEFFAWDSGDDDRYELVDGIAVRMQAGASRMQAGASNTHDRIVPNVIAALHSQLRGSRCRVATADTAVRTRIRNVRRPDVMVTCDEPRADSYESYETRLVVEVLSPSNAGMDWQRNMEEYRRLAGLHHILLIESRSIAATLLTREDAAWTSSDFDDLDAIVDLPQIECRLMMSDIYEGLDFSADPAQRPA